MRYFNINFIYIYYFATFLRRSPRFAIFLRKLFSQYSYKDRIASLYSCEVTKFNFANLVQISFDNNYNDEIKDRNPAITN